MIPQRSGASRGRGTCFGLPPEHIRRTAIPARIDAARLKMRGGHPVGAIKVFTPWSGDRGTGGREGDWTYPQRTGTAPTTISNIDIIGRSRGQTGQSKGIGAGRRESGQIHRSRGTKGHVPQGCAACRPAQSCRRGGYRSHSQGTGGGTCRRLFDFNLINGQITLVGTTTCRDKTNHQGICRRKRKGGIQPWGIIADEGLVATEYGCDP